MNLNYPDLDYPFGEVETLFPETRAAEARTSKALREAALMRRQKRAVAENGDWHYQPALRSSGWPLIPLAISAGLHAFGIFGFNRHPPSKPHEAEEPMIALELMAMLPPEPEPEDAMESSEPTGEAVGVSVPGLPDLPAVVEMDSFLQAIDYASLVPRPDLNNAKVMTIPGNARVGGTGGVKDSLGKIFNLADLDRPPAAVSQPAPVLPPQLTHRVFKVSVVAEFVVTSEGAVVSPRIVSTSDAEFDGVVVKALARWKFKPGMKAGKKVSTHMVQPFTFNFVDNPG